MLEFYGIIENGLLKTFCFLLLGKFRHSLTIAYYHLNIFLFSYITDITAYIEQFNFLIFAVVTCANMAPIFKNIFYNNIEAEIC